MMTHYKKNASRKNAENGPSPQEINMLVALFSQKRYAEMETLARKMTARFPNHGVGWKAMGTALLQQGRNEEALAPLKKAAELSLKDAQPNNSLGNTLLKLNRLSEAEASLRRALELKPNYAEAHYNLGDTLTGQDRLSEAEDSYRRALEFKPDFVEAHSNLGDILYEQGRFSEAEASLRQALEINPEHSNALVGLGNLCRDNGQLERAADLFLHALKSNPNNMAVRLHLAQVKKVKSEDANFAALVECWEVARNSEIPLPRQRATFLHFALGKCYDDSGDYEKAFLHFLEGCKLKRATFDYKQDQPAQQFSEIMRIFDQVTIDRLRGAGNPSHLPIFVLGMPRSGTTLTEQIIASHPDVYGAGELPDLLAIAQRNNTSTATQIAFPGNLRLLNQATLTAWGTEYVAGLQQRAPNARHITDKMPANFFAVGLIHLMLPNAKIIHVNRNPVDTCLSCFTHLFTDHQEHTYDLAELGLFYVAYSRLMEHWRKVLPVGAFLDVNYEDIVADQEAQTRRMIAYCGLEWNDACLDFHKNKRSVQTASVAQVRQPMYKSSVERWRHYEKFLGPLLDALGDLAPKHG